MCRAFRCPLNSNQALPTAHETHQKTGSEAPITARPLAWPLGRGDGAPIVRVKARPSFRQHHKQRCVKSRVEKHFQGPAVKPSSTGLTRERLSPLRQRPMSSNRQRSSPALFMKMYPRSKLSAGCDLGATIELFLSFSAPCTVRPGHSADACGIHLTHTTQGSTRVLISERNGSGLVSSSVL